VHLQVALRVRSHPVESHATKLQESWLRLKARGFTIPEGDTNHLSSADRSLTMGYLSAYGWR
jgi:hypothetical protein